MEYDYDIEQAKERFLEELMAHIIIAGGRKFSETELASMSVGAMLDSFYPNGIRFQIVNMRNLPRNFEE